MLLTYFITSTTRIDTSIIDSMEGINQKEEASTKHEVEVKMEDTDLKEKKGGIKESRVHEKPNKEADIKEEIWNAVQDGDKMKLAELLEKSSPTDMTFQRRDKKVHTKIIMYDR